MSGTSKGTSKGDDGSKPLQVWLSPTERARLLDLAKQERRSMADQVRHLIEQAATTEVDAA